MVLLFRERDEKQSYADRREFFSISETRCDPYFAQFVWWGTESNQIRRAMRGRFAPAAARR
jgi:hypothetical protein